jgi:MFS family permease
MIFYICGTGEPDLNLPAFRLPPALRHRNFTLLWLGLLISTAGSQMQLAALLWHLRILSDQPLLVSGIGLARVLPMFFISPFAGLAADRYNRRRIVFITQTTMIFTAVMLGILTFAGVIQIWHIYLLTIIQATANVFDTPARQSIMPNLVPAKDLPSAFSLQSIAFNTGAILGPGLSGLVIGYMGLQYVYLINAVSFLAVLVALILMGNIAQVSVKTAGGVRSSLRSIREGFSFIRSKPIILSSMLLDFIATFFSSANTLMPFVARDVLHVGEIQYGWLSAAQSMGAVTVGFIFSQRDHIRHQGRLLMGAVLVFGAATAWFGLVNSFWLAMLALLLVGAADAVSTIIRNTIRQLQTPDHIRGRMVGINQIFFGGGPQLGEIEAGVAAQLLGVPFAIISGGIGCIVAVVVLAVIYPQLGHYRGDETIVNAPAAT